MAYRGYKWPKRRDEEDEAAPSFSPGAVFLPGASKMHDFDVPSAPEPE